jgi:hypothetical protein
VPAALPKELRRRIIEAWQAGEGTWEQLAARFKVGVATVDRLVALFRATGSVEPRPHGGGHEPQLTTEHLELLRNLVEAPFGIPDGPCQRFHDPSGNALALLQMDRPNALGAAYEDRGNPHALR